MGKVDFNHYSKNQNPVQECRVGQQDRLTVQFNISEAAVLIAEMHQLCKAGLSPAPSLQNRSTMEENRYYEVVIRSLHVFAIKHARRQLRLPPKDISALFRQKDIKEDKELFE
ncbi:hypothetical protein [Marinicrinis lubricantis]|uniref:Uncharacterized protein n=1 Tax=Marinicrinis lubricantis TaxID=2086470 RepID=A0ABW1IN33_9BACL